MASALESVLPIELDETDRILNVLSELPAIALAVSGGPDSLAMLYLYHSWRKRNAMDQDCVVLTVNHGLREEAEEECRAVAGYCNSLNLNHQILRWKGQKPKSNIQAAAREARYALMEKFMRSKGIRHLVLAHHLDDQAETFLIRLIRGSGVFGLSAMALQSSFGELTLIRPFLEIPKERLIKTLKQAKWKWFEDPSNSSSKHVRGRLRKIMPEFAAEGLTAQRLADTARRMRRTSDAINHAVERLKDSAVETHDAGPVRISLSPIRKSPEEIGLRLLTVVIAQVGGKAYVSRLQKIENLYEKLIVNQKTEFKSATIGGTMLMNGGLSSDCVWVFREFGRGLGKLSLMQGREAVWDDRFKIELNSNAPEEVCVEPLVDVKDVISERLEFPENWPRKAFYASPVVSWKKPDSRKPGSSECFVDYFAYGLENKTPAWLTVKPVNQ